MSALLFLAQRATAVVLAFAVAVHLGTILYAVRGGLTAADMLARTHGNLWFLIFYGVFVVAVAIHAPIGLRNIMREWTAWRGTSLDIALASALNGAQALDSFLAVTRQPLVATAEVGIVVALALHMTLGLRVLAIEFFDMREKTLVPLSVCLAAVVAVGALFILNLG